MHARQLKPVIGMEWRVPGDGPRGDPQIEAGGAERNSAVYCPRSRSNPEANPMRESASETAGATTARTRPEAD